MAKEQNLDDLKTQDRLSREQAFHNARFSKEVRDVQNSFYATLSNMFARYERLTEEFAQNKRVLEYGCARGERPIRLSRSARSVLGIDISPVAISQANEAANGITNISFRVMNAEALDIEDQSIDFIFGSGILHHLDLTKAYSEIARVLAPGGIALFAEPLGHNPIINAYRKRTPEARTVDERPMTRTDIECMRAHFTQIECEFFGLLTLAAIPFRNALGSKAMISTLQALDKPLLRLPGLRWQAWYALLIARK